MKAFGAVLTLAFAGAALLSAAEPTLSATAKAMDGDLKGIERELVPLVEAMPADKINFAPSEGEFKGVRTFAQQAKHVGAVLYIVAASMLQEKPPAEAGEGEDGPASVTSQEQIVKYLKDAFAYSHKALASLTDAAATDMVKSPFGTRKVSRLSLASILTWHSFDHYGQMVVYARMNGIVPPASRK